MNVERLEIGLVQAIDVRVRRDEDARLREMTERPGRGLEAPSGGAHEIVRGLEAVDADARGVQPRLRHRQGPRSVDAPPARRRHRPHARLPERRDDLEEAGVEVGLAADENDLLRPHRGELLDHAQRFLGRELARPRLACPRAAVRAGLVALQRELPDDVGRMKVVHDALAVLRGHDRQLDTARGCHRTLAEDTLNEDMATKLQQCGCGGFVPGSLTACPHCGITVAGSPSRSTMRATAGGVARRLRLRTLGGALGGGAIAFTLMACYGGAPCPDGTRDCYKTPPSNAPEAPGTFATPPGSSMPMASDAGKP